MSHDVNTECMEKSYEAGYEDAYKEVFGAIKCKVDEMKETRDELLKKGHQRDADKYDVSIFHIKRIADKLFGEAKGGQINAY